MSAPGRAPSREDLAAVQMEMEEILAAGEQMKAQLGAIEEQRALLRSVVEDYARGREALEALKAGATEDDVLVPLGGGNYARARLTGGDRVLTAVGAGVHVENSVEQALARLAERIESASKAGERLTEEGRRLNADLQRLNAHLQALAQGAGFGSAPE